MTVDGEGATHPADEAPTKPRRPRPWLIVVAAVCIVGEVVNGLLNVLGAGTSPLINVLSAIGLMAGFAIAIVKALADDLKAASRRARTGYITAVVMGSILLLVAGLATRVVAPLHRMAGTSDVAIIGIRAPTPDQQGEFDDVAASLADAMPGSSDAEVHDYSDLAKAPLDELGQPDASPELNRWLAGFLDETDAEFVLAGSATREQSGQVTIQFFAFVTAHVATDATELAGWYALKPYRSDRTLESSRARRALVEVIVAEYSGLAGFLQGLDAWQSGYAAESVEIFTKTLENQPVSSPSTLRDLTHLFRGHARETQSRGSAPGDRTNLLLQARDDYEAIATDSAIADRARLSSATNQYLRSAASGCTPGSDAVGDLVESAKVLEEIAANAESSLLLRLRAQVNQAQLYLCLRSAEQAEASARLDPLLAELTTTSVPDPSDPRSGSVRQIKALAFSIQAVLLVDGHRLRDAVDSITAALDLDPRLERQALWLGLKSSWLLASCRVKEGQEAQRNSLLQLEAAVSEKRLPTTHIEQYSRAFADDLAEANRRCGKNAQPR